MLTGEGVLAPGTVADGEGALTLEGGGVTTVAVVAVVVVDGAWIDGLAFALTEGDAVEKRVALTLTGLVVVVAAIVVSSVLLVAEVVGEGVVVVVAFWKAYLPQRSVVFWPGRESEQR